MYDIEDRIHDRAWMLWIGAGRRGRFEDFWNEAAATVLGADDFNGGALESAAEEERAASDRCAAADDPEPEELDGPGATGRAGS